MKARSATWIERLREGAWGFEFFEAVRLLVRSRPDAHLGEFEHPGEEPLRFEAVPSLAFPASEIQEVIEEERDPNGRSAPPTMRVNVMGLTGALGVMPRYYTELMRDLSGKSAGAALRAFLDVFNHRLLALFFRAWAKYRVAVGYERGGRRPLVQAFLSFVGMGTAGVQGRQNVRDEVLLHYAGLLAQHPRSAGTVENLLADYFDVPVRIEQFVGEPVFMNPEVLTRIGGPRQNDQLGITAVLWERLRDPQSRFRIVVGPLGRDAFVAFLPDGDAYIRLVELTRFCVGDEFSFEVQPLLRPEEVPPLQVRATPIGRLGWSTWLRTQPFMESPAYPVFDARSGGWR
jgi:type VI secretion system protein ImpH